MRSIPRLRKKKAVAAVAAVGALLFANVPSAWAYEILGTGTGSLIGNDLTDLGDDGDPEADFGYDAIFDSSDEPGFAGGEFAFNVFDNVLGPGNAKWCCGMGGGISEDNPAWVSAQFPLNYFLTGFTVSSANDVPARDPNFWAIQGSNDGVNYTDIYVYDDAVGPWEDRLQVVEFKEGDDFPVQTTSYGFLRFAAYNTPSNPSGAYYQVGEIEFFGKADGVVPPIFVGGQGTIGQQVVAANIVNKQYGTTAVGGAGWGVKLVDSDTTIDSHTKAENALNTDDGEVTFATYDYVDLGGGDGTFVDTTEPYPNDIGPGDTSMSDFAVRASANVVIPPGRYTVGFGSDDGGQLTIAGIVFDGTLTSDSSDSNQIRYEGNRGHGWTVGTFEVTGGPLSTSIIASMHERGGGDSFEVAIVEGEELAAADPGNWDLLADGTLGWTLQAAEANFLGADLTGKVGATRVWQIDVNGDTDASDQFVMSNPDPNIYTSILNMDGVTLQVNAIGAVANGDAFKIVDVDSILGNVTVTSVVAGQTWVFDNATGRVCLGSCPGVSSGGDYNGDGVVDASDADAQAVAMKTPTQNLAKFDENGDGTIDYADRLVWVKTHAFGGKGTWVGDADLNGEFNSSDFVTVFTAGKYESGGPAGWGEGDWDGDGVFGSGDFVAAFSDGGYEQGQLPAAVSAVPEPTSCLLMALGMLGIGGLRRRRS